MVTATQEERNRQNLNDIGAKLGRRQQVSTNELAKAYVVIELKDVNRKSSSFNSSIGDALGAGLYAWKSRLDPFFELWIQDLKLSDQQAQDLQQYLVEKECFWASMFDLAQFSDFEKDPRRLCTRAWCYYDQFATKKHGKFIDDPERILAKVEQKFKNLRSNSRNRPKPSDRFNAKVIKPKNDIPAGFCYAWHGPKQLCSNKSCDWYHHCWKCFKVFRKHYDHSAYTCRTSV